LYGLLLLPFNARLIQMAWCLHGSPDDLQRARGLFRWSILYLFGICLLLLLARLPAAEPFSLQVVVLLKHYSAGPGAFTLMPVPVI
jgi:protoheme IX farnesyltransferase